MNIQPCTSMYRILMYCTKYISKSNKARVTLHEMLDTVLDRTADNTRFKIVFRKLLLAQMALQERSAQKVAHNSLCLLLYAHAPLYVQIAIQRLSCFCIPMPPLTLLCMQTLGHGMRNARTWMICRSSSICKNALRKPHYALGLQWCVCHPSSRRCQTLELNHRFKLCVVCCFVQDFVEQSKVTRALLPLLMYFVQYMGTWYMLLQGWMSISWRHAINHGAQKFLT
ncbi:hypothetical protein BCR37DRAFT_378989 [Protomyces lactucae-debilis]|uniref:Uncharacterized protein n=1 Tax=Protomyces lactucae-debilis TaxID=2754530 RepID=A0A1Y2FJS8_PROLT|nr:uncharacterized protein BCR37DRAFT_378989 [Protomyces lactucae-debilis]ORY83045.1 hypothetical protein BCR37DRAFT_378989 [Protomyces lactucae-debilis]